MLKLMLAIFLALLLIVRGYEIIRYKEKLTYKNWLFVIASTLLIISIVAEKIFKITL